MKPWGWEVGIDIFLKSCRVAWQHSQSFLLFEIPCLINVSDLGKEREPGWEWECTEVLKREQEVPTEREQIAIANAGGGHIAMANAGGEHIAMANAGGGQTAMAKVGGGHIEGSVEQTWQSCIHHPKNHDHPCPQDSVSLDTWQIFIWDQKSMASRIWSGFWRTSVGNCMFHVPTNNLFTQEPEVCVWANRSFPR